MSPQFTPRSGAAPLQRTYASPPERLWELLTTPAGIEQWWRPEGFATRVDALALEPGGQVRITMTATAPEQVAFVRDLGLPLASEFVRTYTEVVAPARLAYLSTIDFVPGQEPYEHLTVIDLTPAGDRTTLVMTLDTLHDEAWTRDYRDHRADELDKLSAVLGRSAT